MAPPLSLTTKRMIFAGGVILALALTAAIGWRLLRPPVPVGDVAAFLDKSVGAGKVRFADLRIGTARLGDEDLQMTVVATARTLWPLYAKADTADYLRSTLNIDPGLTTEARRLLADRDVSQKPEFLRLGPPPPDPDRAVLLTMTAQAGTAFPYQGMIAAHREEGQWSFTLLSGAYEGPSPAGEARSSFGNATFVAGDARDDARLRALAADFKSFATRVSETQHNLEATHAVALNLRREALASWLAVGSVFRGVALRPGEQQGTTLYLEITGLSAGNGVTALLRNTGGWHYARAFEGSWTADDDLENVMLTLASPPDQAVRNAGPILENTQAWTLALQMDPKGNLSGTTRFFQYRFQFLNAGQVAPIKAALEAEFERARSATEPGSLFSGTAVSKASGSSEPVLLRFTGRSQDVDAFQAALESTARSWKRPLHGTIIGNARRSDGQPIRLRSGALEAAADAPVDSVLGDHEDLDVRLGIEDGALVGEDEHFTYRFTAARAGDLSSMDAARSARAARFSAVLRDGISYDGIIRDDQGSNAQARLEIAHIDRQKGTITASIHSLSQFNIYQDFLGAWNPADASLTLATTGRGQFDFEDDLAVPFLVAPVAHTLHLALVGTAITGTIEGDTHWSMEFPVGTFLAARTEGVEPDSSPASAVFPPFPKGSGAYVLVAGKWTALPHNGGHVIVETSHAMTGEELSGGPLGVVSAGVRRFTEKGEKTTYLEFDGKEPRPECDEPAVVLLFSGPELSWTPPVELAPLGNGKDGKRRIVILKGPAGTIRFGEQRAAAYVRRVGPGLILLTTTSALPTGPYAFNADVGYELTIRQ